MDFSVAKVEAMVRQRGNKSKGKYGFLSLGFGTAEKEKKRSSWLGLARLTRLSLRFRAGHEGRPYRRWIGGSVLLGCDGHWMDGCCKRLSLRLRAATRAAPTDDGLAAVYYWDVTVMVWMDGCCKRLSLRFRAATRAAPTGDDLMGTF
jgi:hypothetical protein